MSTVRLPSTCMFKAAPHTQKKSIFVKIPSSLGAVRSILKYFGLKADSGFRASANMYKVKLVCPDGTEHEFEAPCNTTSSMQLKKLESNSHIRAGLVLAPHVLGR